MVTLRILFRATALLLCLSFAPHAETILLRNGQTIDGAIRSSAGNFLTVSVAGNEMQILKSFVAAVDGDSVSPLLTVSAIAGPTTASTDPAPAIPVSRGANGEDQTTETEARTCRFDMDCPGEMICENGECTAPAKARDVEPHRADTRTPCSVDVDCPGDKICCNGFCEEPHGKADTIEHPSRACRGVDSDCPGDEICVDGYCAPAGGISDIAAVSSADAGGHEESLLKPGMPIDIRNGVYFQNEAVFPPVRVRELLLTDPACAPFVHSAVRRQKASNVFRIIMGVVSLKTGAMSAISLATGRSEGFVVTLVDGGVLLTSLISWLALDKSADRKLERGVRRYNDSLRKARPDLSFVGDSHFSMGQRDCP